MVICLERGADLHMAQLMPLPLTVSCFSKIQIGFAFLVPAHPGSPGKRAVKRVCRTTYFLTFFSRCKQRHLAFVGVVAHFFLTRCLTWQSASITSHVTLYPVFSAKRHVLFVYCVHVLVVDMHVVRD